MMCFLLILGMVLSLTSLIIGILKHFYPIEIIESRSIYLIIISTVCALIFTFFGILYTKSLAKENYYN